MVGALQPSMASDESQHEITLNPIQAELKGE